MTGWQGTPRQPVVLLFDDGETTHVWAEHVGDGDGAVGVLVVFHNRNHGAWNAQPRAIEGMHEFSFGASLAAEADVGGARLEAFDV